MQLSSTAHVYIYTLIAGISFAHTLLMWSMSYALHGDIVQLVVAFQCLELTSSAWASSVPWANKPKQCYANAMQTCKCIPEGLLPTYRPDSIWCSVLQLQMCANGRLMSTGCCHHTTRHQALSSAKLTSTMPSMKRKSMVNLMSAPYTQPTPRLACWHSVP